MKKLLTLAFCLSTGFFAGAQEFPADLGTNPKYDEHRELPTIYHHLADPGYRFAVGFEFAYPVYTLSFKYAVTEASVLQALASPAAATYGRYDYSFYGARYIYRFPFNVAHFYGPNTVSYPYIFGGAGLLSYNMPVFDGYGIYDHSTNHSVLGYSLGAGYEWIIDRHFGVALEAGYGAMTANGTSAENTFTYTGALHYYFEPHHRQARVSENESAEATGSDEQEASENGDQPDDEKPAPRGRRHRARVVEEIED